MTAFEYLRMQDENVIAAVAAKVVTGVLTDITGVEIPDEIVEKCRNGVLEVFGKDMDEICKSHG